jgi:hypothetical protein
MMCSVKVGRVSKAINLPKNLTMLGWGSHMCSGISSALISGPNPDIPEPGQGSKKF